MLMLFRAVVVNALKGKVCFGSIVTTIERAEKNVPNTAFMAGYTHVLAGANIFVDALTPAKALPLLQIQLDEDLQSLKDASEDTLNYTNEHVEWLKKSIEAAQVMIDLCQRYLETESAMSALDQLDNVVVPA
jgi:hypothetical protein